jgi:hypothetical protein
MTIQSKDPKFKSRIGGFPTFRFIKPHQTVHDRELSALTHNIKTRLRMTRYLAFLVACASLAYSVPSFSERGTLEAQRRLQAQAINSTCASAAVTKGLCMPYPADGICAPYIYNFSANHTVWIPEDHTVADMELVVTAKIRSLLRNQAVISRECHLFANAFVCANVFPMCSSSLFPDQYPDEDIPLLSCNTFCDEYWSTCQATIMAYEKQVLKGDYASSNFPNCVPTTSPTGALWSGTFNASWPGNPQPQPPDTFGGRPILNSYVMPSIPGLLGQLRFPVNEYNYTYANGSIVNVQCIAPEQNYAQLLSVPVSCTTPFIPNGDGICSVPCPFPVFTAEQQNGIQTAFVVPGIVGLILSVFILADSLWVMHEATGGRGMLFPSIMFAWRSQRASKSSEQVVPSSLEQKARKPKHRIRASTKYALAGSLLGILYFIIGPLATLMYASEVSCSSPYLDLPSIFASQVPADPPICVAQRASPFVLQAIFNLVLFAMVNLFMVVDARARRLGPTAKRAVAAVAWAYCAGLPALMLIVALALDQLSDDLFTLFAQLGRQTTICQVRLTSEAEISLVYGPFLLTGTFIVIIALLVLGDVKSVRKKTEMFKTSSPHDVAFKQMIDRLTALGLATFAVLIVLMATTSVFQQELKLFGPAFDLFFACQVIAYSCLDCGAKKQAADALLPSPIVPAIQLASMSAITLLFGVFFGALSLTRLRKAFAARRQRPMSEQNRSSVGRVQSQTGRRASTNATFTEREASGDLHCSKLERIVSLHVRPSVDGSV